MRVPGVRQRTVLSPVLVHLLRRRDDDHRQTRAAAGERSARDGRVTFGQPLPGIGISSTISIELSPIVKWGWPFIVSASASLDAACITE